jgi:hypothetical protein
MDKNYYVRVLRHTRSSDDGATAVCLSCNQLHHHHGGGDVVGGGGGGVARATFRRDLSPLAAAASTTASTTCSSTTHEATSAERPKVSYRRKKSRFLTRQVRTNQSPFPKRTVNTKIKLVSILVAINGSLLNGNETSCFSEAVFLVRVDPDPCPDLNFGPSVPWLCACVCVSVKRPYYKAFAKRLAVRPTARSAPSVSFWQTFP